MGIEQSPFIWDMQDDSRQNRMLHPKYRHMLLPKAKMQETCRTGEFCDKLCQRKRETWEGRALTLTLMRSIVRAAAVAREETRSALGVKCQGTEGLGLSSPAVLGESNPVHLQS